MLCGDSTPTCSVVRREFGDQILISRGDCKTRVISFLYCSFKMNKIFLFVHFLAEFPFLESFYFWKVPG